MIRNPHAREPLRTPSGHLLRPAQQGPPDRGRHQRRHARDPPGTLGGRCQLQGSEELRRPHQGALPFRRRAGLAHPGPERREDRARRADRAARPHRFPARALKPHPQCHHARGPAGLRQDHGGGQARLPAEAGESLAAAHRRRRVPSRGGRPATDARRRDRRAGLPRRRARSGGHRARGHPGRHRQPARRGHHRHGGPSARGRRHDGGPRPSRTPRTPIRSSWWWMP